MAFPPLSGLWNLVSQRCNNFLLPGSSRSTCCKFVLDGFFVGLIRPDILTSLLTYSDVFVWFTDSVSGERCVTLHPSHRTFHERTNAVRHVMQDLRSSGTIPTLRGWRNEDYGVYVQNCREALFSIERSASPLLGFTRYGIHVNGFFFRHSDSVCDRTDHLGSNRFELNGALTKYAVDHMDPARTMMWIGVRSMNKPTWPGMLDNLAAGGLTYGLDYMECARKECREEASVPEELLDKLKPVSLISYVFEDERGVCPHVEHCFDLELPCDFVPVNADGEVDSFQLISISQIKELILSDKFKANSALVILDFLYRHKFIDADSDPFHKDIISLMHVNFEFD